MNGAPPPPYDASSQQIIPFILWCAVVLAIGYLLGGR